LVGIGRWWEDPRAGLLQHVGIGSVAYVFALAFLLWLILWPLGPKHWSYFNILTFVSLTSPPGILYAIPVRHGLNIHVAQSVRLWFLAIVAGWRVLLMGYYLGRGAGFSGFTRFVATMFPLGLIVFTLTALNLEKVVFNFMGGVEEQDRSVNDGAYGVLFLITMLSSYLFIPLFLCHAGICIRTVVLNYSKRKPEPGSDQPPWGCTIHEWCIPAMDAREQSPANFLSMAGCAPLTGEVAQALAGLIAAVGFPEEPAQPLLQFAYRHQFGAVIYVEQCAGVPESL
jgi:hypothetical protein